jgi:hypothetical protein
MIIKDFVHGIHDSMLDTEEELHRHLSDQYVTVDWKLTFNAIFEAEEDNTATFAALEKLEAAVKVLRAMDSPLAQAASPTQPSLPQLVSLKTDFMSSVVELKTHKRIVDTAPMLKDLLNPVEEWKVSESPYDFPGGDEEIMQQAVQDVNRAKMIEGSDSKDEGNNDGDEMVDLLYHEGAELCEWLEKACVIHCNADGVSVLASSRSFVPTSII